MISARWTQTACQIFSSILFLLLFFWNAVIIIRDDGISKFPIPLSLSFARELHVVGNDTYSEYRSYWEVANKPFCSVNNMFVQQEANSAMMMRGKTHRGKLASLSQRQISDNALCQVQSCSANAFCFMGACPCKPGWTGDSCDQRLAVANPWYTTLCPNLEMKNTLDVNLPLESVGGEYDSRHQKSIDKPFCAYLCYSHQSYGTAVVPIALWLAAQKAESALWATVGTWAKSTDSNDRAQEHWSAYNKFAMLDEDLDLGRVIEVGAGPWTQLKGFLYLKPKWKVTSFLVWEPGAKNYMKDVPSCSYKSGNMLTKWQGNGYHSFPVTVNSQGGELLTSTKMTVGQSPPTSSTTSSIGNTGLAAEKSIDSKVGVINSQLRGSDPSLDPNLYDTLISINVLEHVQDAFKYLTGLYLALKPGGMLIMHERYYDDVSILQGDNFHPVRIKRQVLDRFLAGFKIIFNNCTAAYDGRVGEHGYYVIATKV